jgi:hypothetical protein
VAGDDVVAHPGAHQPRSDVVRAGRRARVLERAGVGDQPGVDGGRDVDRELDAEPVDELEREHGRGRRGDVDERQRREPGVGRVVVDGDERRGRLGGLAQDAQPLDRAHVEGGDHGCAVMESGATRRCCPAASAARAAASNGSSP